MSSVKTVVPHVFLSVIEQQCVIITPGLERAKQLGSLRPSVLIIYLAICVYAQLRAV